MNGFNYFNPARVVFGNKPYESIEAFLKESGAKSLMMIHTGSAVRLGIFDEIRAMCERLGITFVSNGSVQSNPKIELIRELVEEGRSEKTDMLLAAGGGLQSETLCRMIASLAGKPIKLKKGYSQATIQGLVAICNKTLEVTADHEDEYIIIEPEADNKIFAYYPVWAENRNRANECE